MSGKGNWYGKVPRNLHYIYDRGYRTGIRYILKRIQAGDSIEDILKSCCVSYKKIQTIRGDKIKIKGRTLRPLKGGD